jgi:hypothetical protein
MINAGSEPKIDAVFDVDTPAHGTHFRPEDPLEGDGHGFDQRDLKPTFATRGRHFRSDETCTDHDDPSWTCFKIGPKGHRIVKGAYDMDPSDTLGTRKSTSRCARGDYEAVEPNRGGSAVGGKRFHSATRKRKPSGPDTKLHVETEIFVGGGEDYPLWIPFTRKDLLRQGRTVVRTIRISVEDDNWPVMALKAECPGRVHTREGCTNDDD